MRTETRTGQLWIALDNGETVCLQAGYLSLYASQTDWQNREAWNVVSVGSGCSVPLGAGYLVVIPEAVAVYVSEQSYKNGENPIAILRTEANHVSTV